jgi:hypothetical protein
MVFIYPVANCKLALFVVLLVNWNVMVIFNSTDRCQIIYKTVSTDRIERHSGSS